MHNYFPHAKALDNYCTKRAVYRTIGAWAANYFIFFIKFNYRFRVVSPELAAINGAALTPRTAASYVEQKQSSNRASNRCLCPYQRSQLTRRIIRRNFRLRSSRCRSSGCSKCHRRMRRRCGRCNCYNNLRLYLPSRRRCRRYIILFTTLECCNNTTIPWCNPNHWCQQFPRRWIKSPIRIGISARCSATLTADVFAP